MERIEQARQALEAAKTALEYSVNSLDGVVSTDEEDEGEDGGSLACQACIKIDRRAIAKIDAALSALEAEGGAAVKALRWVARKGLAGASAHSDCGLYEVGSVHGRFLATRRYVDADAQWADEVVGRFGTEAEAKAAVQADHERRILSALKDQPVTGWRSMDSAPKNFTTLLREARRATEALHEWTEMNEAEWTGWGDQVVPPSATFWRVKVGQAVKALDELPPAQEGGNHAE